MRGSAKTLVAAAVVLLLALGLVACGGGGDDSGPSGQDTQQPAGGSSGGGESSGEDSSSDSEDDLNGFVPNEYDDSGGGSAQFKVKGGDNSVQEFGEEADASERDAAAEVLHNFLDARAEGNWSAACAYIATSVVESFEKLAAQAERVEATSCAEILEALTNPVALASMKEEAKRADVGSLRVEEGRAFIIYRGVDGMILAMPMTSEDSAWKVASLAGTPLN